MCGLNQVGCLKFEDCQTGLYCDTDIPQPSCQDFNECDLASQTYFNGLEYCGEHATCSNTVGSLSCSCETGFLDWKANEGCMDRNECTEVQIQYITNIILPRVHITATKTQTASIHPGRLSVSVKMDSPAVLLQM